MLSIFKFLICCLFSLEVSPSSGNFPESMHPAAPCHVPTYHTFYKLPDHKSIQDLVNHGEFLIKTHFHYYLAGKTMDSNAIVTTITWALDIYREAIKRESTEQMADFMFTMTKLSFKGLALDLARISEVVYLPVIR
jgi:hypothetical protein